MQIRIPLPKTFYRRVQNTAAIIPSTVILAAILVQIYQFLNPWPCSLTPRHKNSKTLKPDSPIGPVNPKPETVAGTIAVVPLPWRLWTSARYRTRANLHDILLETM